MNDHPTSEDISPMSAVDQPANGDASLTIQYNSPQVGNALPQENGIHGEIIDTDMLVGELMNRGPPQIEDNIEQPPETPKAQDPVFKFIQKSDNVNIEHAPVLHCLNVNTQRKNWPI